MKTLTHFLDTPKRSEISALLKPLPISSKSCDSRRLNNIGRSSLTAFRLLRFLVIDSVSRFWRRDGEATCNIGKSSLTSFHAAGLVMGLLQRRYPRWLALGRGRASR